MTVQLSLWPDLPTDVQTFKPFSYQVEPGAHFCLGCGVTLGPWAESHGWWYCSGPTGRCLKIQGKSIELQGVPFRAILSGDLFWDAEREQWQKEGTDKAMRLSDYREREFEQGETVFVNDYINQ